MMTLIFVYTKSSDWASSKPWLYWFSFSRW